MAYLSCRGTDVMVHGLLLEGCNSTGIKARLAYLKNALLRAFP